MFTQIQTCTPGQKPTHLRVDPQVHTVCPTFTPQSQLPFDEIAMTHKHWRQRACCPFPASTLHTHPPPVLPLNPICDPARHVSMHRDGRGTITERSRPSDRATRGPGQVVGTEGHWGGQSRQADKEQPLWGPGGTRRQRTGVVAPQPSDSRQLPGNSHWPCPAAGGDE